MGGLFSKKKSSESRVTEQDKAVLVSQFFLSIDKYLFKDWF